jgi:hypothetical protein
MGIRETHPLRAELVEVGRCNFSPCVCDVAVSHVISEDEDEVRFGEDAMGEEQGAGGEEQDFHFLFR